MSNISKSVLSARMHQSMLRELTLTGSSLGSVSIWTFSGVVLVSCGGGGGGRISISGGNDQRVINPQTQEELVSSSQITIPHIPINVVSYYPVIEFTPGHHTQPAQPDEGAVISAVITDSSVPNKNSTINGSIDGIFTVVGQDPGNVKIPIFKIAGSIQIVDDAKLKDSIIITHSYTIPNGYGTIHFNDGSDPDSRSHAGKYLYERDETKINTLNSDDIKTDVIQVKASIGTTEIESQTLAFNIIGTNDLPTAISFARQTLYYIDENAELTNGIKVAEITVTDPDNHDFGSLSPAGIHASYFTIRNDNELWLVLENGNSINFEYLDALTVHVHHNEDHALRSNNDIVVTINNIDETDAKVNIQRTSGVGKVEIGHIYAAKVTTDVDNRDLGVDATNYGHVTSYTYQWVHVGDGHDGIDVPISGQTESTYTIKHGDSGKILGLRVTYTDLAKDSINNPVTVYLPADQQIIVPSFDSQQANTQKISSNLNQLSQVGDTVSLLHDFTGDGLSSNIEAIYYSQYVNTKVDSLYGPGSWRTEHSKLSANQVNFSLNKFMFEKRVYAIMDFVNEEGESFTNLNFLGYFDAGDSIVAATPLTSISELVYGIHEVNANINDVDDVNDIDVYSFTSKKRQIFTFTQGQNDTISDLRFVIYDEDNNIVKDSIARSLGAPAILSATLDGFGRGTTYYLKAQSVSGNQGKYSFTYETSPIPSVTITSPTVLLFEYDNTAGVFSADATTPESNKVLNFTSLETSILHYTGLKSILDAHDAKFGGAVVNSSDSRRASITYSVSNLDDIVFNYMLSGEDVDDVMFVQKGNKVYLISVDSFDYEHPNDIDLNNTYDIVESVTTTSVGIPLEYWELSRTYSLSVSDDTSELSMYETPPLYKPLPIGKWEGYQFTSGYGDNDLFMIKNEQVFWKTTPDFEEPHDGNYDNHYEIELFTTDDNDLRNKFELSIVIKDIHFDIPPQGRGQLYSPAIYLIPSDIGEKDKPSIFVQHLLSESAWTMPKKGPLIITYSISSKERDELSNDIFPNDATKVANFYSKLEANLLSFEQAANLKFIEIEHGKEEDIIYEYPNRSPEVRSPIPHIRLEFWDGHRSYAGTGPDGALINFAYNGVKSKPDRIIVHEFGHAIGLHHPFEDTRYPLSRPFDPEQDWPGNEKYRESLLSVMSYNSEVKTLQPADIDALEFLYGAPGTNFEGVESLFVDAI